MTDDTPIKITIVIDVRGNKAPDPIPAPAEPPGFGPIYRGPIREAPGLHPYRPTLALKTIWEKP